MRILGCLLATVAISCAQAEADAPVLPSKDSGAADTNIADTATPLPDSMAPTIDSSTPPPDSSDDSTAPIDSSGDTDVADSTLDTSPDTTPEVSVDAGAIAATWSTNTTTHRCMLGARYTYSCPAGGTAGSVWGSGTYTDDSSLCTAAVHAGVLTLAGGGTATIEVRAGESSYTGTTANGITSSSYGSWLCSFAVVGGSSMPGPMPATWTTNARIHECRIGERFEYSCPPSGSASTVWGSSPYTHDSSICTAAVHAGKISLASGGPITIEMRAGEASYSATTANGITTLSYGSWTCSFVLL